MHRNASSPGKRHKGFDTFDAIGSQLFGNVQEILVARDDTALEHRPEILVSSDRNSDTQVSFVVR